MIFVDVDHSAIVQLKGAFVWWPAVHICQLEDLNAVAATLDSAHTGSLIFISASPKLYVR